MAAKQYQKEETEFAALEELCQMILIDIKLQCERNVCQSINIAKGKRYIVQ